MHSIDPSGWIFLSAAAVVILLICELRGFRPGIAPAKLTASTAFVGLALSLGALDSSLGQIILIGLLLCWLGDALLIPTGQSFWFQLGIGSFLLGHVAYAIAFVTWAVSPAALVVGGLVMAATGALAFRWLRPDVPANFRKPVIAYIVVIGAMAACAISASTGGAPLSVAVGALAFAASDLSVARDRFVAPNFVHAAWGLPAYFAAQMILASSIRLL